MPPIELSTKDGGEGATCPRISTYQTAKTMLLQTYPTHFTFALMAHFENPEIEPREVGRFRGFEESCTHAREFAESTPGVESVVVHEVLRNGELGSGEVCFLG